MRSRQPATLDERVVHEIARRLDRAGRERRRVARVTVEHPDLGFDDAYAIQDALQTLQQARGTRVRGYKAGVTSFERLCQLGLAEPLYGFLTDEGAVADGAEVMTARLHQPRIEMELAFVLARELGGAQCTVEQVLDAAEYVCPALEIIDSRYPPGPFDPVAAVADNVSGAHYVLGAARAAARMLEPQALRAVLVKNGEAVAEGTAAAVLGHPGESVAGLVRALWRRGKCLPAGSVVLTGGITEALGVMSGDAVAARFDGLGEVGCRFR